MPLLVLLSGSTTSQPDYSLPNLVLMAVYVFFTLVIAIAAIWSAIITRNALKASSKQAQEALAASEKQSQAAIDAVNKQIEASEKQSKETIDAVNRQIEVSERQAQEALYNQHKPIVIPISEAIEKMGPPKEEARTVYTVGIQNKGAGVALNAFAIMGVKDLPVILCSWKIWFLAPGDEEKLLFKVRGEVMYPFNVFEEINVFPQVGARLMVTYNDAFSNKYFAVFDYETQLGWKQVDAIKRVEKRIDELIIIKH